MQYAQKKRGTFRIFSFRGVWRNLSAEYLKARTTKREHFCNIPAEIHWSPNFLNDRIKLKRFFNIS